MLRLLSLLVLVSLGVSGCCPLQGSSLMARGCGGYRADLVREAPAQTRAAKHLAAQGKAVHSEGRDRTSAVA